MHPAFRPGGGYYRWRVSVQRSRCAAIANDLRGTVLEAAAAALAAQAATTTYHGTALACCQQALVLWTAAGFRDRPVLLQDGRQG